MVYHNPRRFKSDVCTKAKLHISMVYKFNRTYFLEKSWKSWKKLEKVDQQNEDKYYIYKYNGNCESESNFVEFLYSQYIIQIKSEEHFNYLKYLLVLSILYYQSNRVPDLKAQIRPYLYAEFSDLKGDGKMKRSTSYSQKDSSLLP